MAKKLFKDIDKLISKASSRALKEAMVELGLESSEEQLQKQKSSDLKPFKASKKKSSDSADEAPEDSTKQRELIKVKKDDSPNITLKKISDQIDTLRSGHSLKDKEIRKQLKDYFDRLSSNEKTALYAFLKGLSKIMATGTDGSEVEAPTDEPYDIKMDREKPKAKPSKRDDDAPIVVGEVADKRRDRALFERRNRK